MMRFRTQNAPRSRRTLRDEPPETLTNTAWRRDEKTTTRQFDGRSQDKGLAAEVHHSAPCSYHFCAAVLKRRARSQTFTPPAPSKMCDSTSTESSAVSPPSTNGASSNSCFMFGRGAAIVTSIASSCSVAVGVLQRNTIGGWAVIKSVTTFLTFLFEGCWKAA